MRLVLALLLCLTVACSASPVSTAPTRVAGVHEGSFVAPSAVASTVVQIASMGQSGLVALDSDGLVWVLSDGAWYQLQPGAAPFVSVAGTPQGTTYAADGDGKVWRFVGGAAPWAALPSPGE